MIKKYPGAQPLNQRGAVLIISLVVLTVLTIVVLSANRGVVIQERMTSAIRESNVAFQSAESGLVEAELFIETIPGIAIFSDVGANGLYTQNNGPADYSDPAVWDPGITRLAAETAPGYETRYFIENLGAFAIGGIAQDISLNNDYSQPEIDTVAEVFRVVVRTVGPNGQPVRIIAGYYSANLN
ncbi:pilus assembly PilX family protein [Sessilibacter corallicola]|uniref:Type 4 fimbrial biogenesis protein PilX N-terminal domain-containing protein n=1 Tax=Sessilibacter corallicola TaxID=2904075 RepID=A0ABQ0A7A6_9GAMM